MNELEVNDPGDDDTAAGSWNSLSTELQDRVLAFLPVLCLFQLRTVCKRWAARPSSSSFHNMCSQVSPQPAYLLICRRAHTFCTAYDESLDMWYGLDLRFLDSQCQQYWKCDTGDVYHSIEAASGGLFFVWSHKSDGGPAIFSVCNPVTRAWRKLPSLPYYIVPLAVAMTTDRATSAYKIYVAADGAGEPSMVMQVYNSGSHHWQKLGVMPPNLDIVWSSVVCGNIMYVLSFDPCDLWSYYMKDNIWSKMDIQVPYSLSMTLLVDCSGTLFLVGESRGCTPQCISIWEFNMDERSCMEIAQIPNPVFQDFASDEAYGMWTAIGHRQGIAFKKGVTRTLMYDVLQKSVSWLPNCPGSFDYDSGYSVYGFSSTLSFAATV